MKTKIFIGIFAGLLLASCKNFLEEYSQNLSYVNTVDDLDQLLMGNAYFPDRTSVSTFLWLNYMDDDTEEIWTSATTTTPGVPEYMRGFHHWEAYPYWEDRAVATVSRQPYGGNKLWSDFYEKLAVINVVIEEAERFANDENNHDTYLRVLGEAYFLRAQYYFTMANIWGPPYDAATASSDLAVPMKLYSYIENEGFARNTIEEVYDQVVEDLETSVRYFEGLPLPTNKMHAGAPAAKLLLSRVYLFMCDWEKAEYWADEVLDGVSSTTYSLYDFNSNGYTTSSYKTAAFTNGVSWCETLLVNGYSATTMAQVAVNFCVSEECNNLYLDNDWRQSYWLTQGKRNNYTWVKSVNLSSNSAISPMALNLPEAYLNKAEAAAMQDDWTGAANALKAIREKRIKTGMEDIPFETYTGETMISFIREERRRELAFKGLRWFDLRRYAVLPKYQLKTTIRHPYYAWQNDSPLLLGYHVLGEWPEDGGWVLCFPLYALASNKGALVDNIRPERTLE